MKALEHTVNEQQATVNKQQTTVNHSDSAVTKRVVILGIGASELTRLFLVDYFPSFVSENLHSVDDEMKEERFADL
jgi:hypothetical protein